MHQWSFKSLRSGSTFVLVLVLIASAIPTTMAEEHLQVDPPLVNFYLDDASLTLEAPTGEDTQRGSIMGTPTTPITGFIIPYGGMDLDGPITFTTDMSVTLWIEAEEAQLYTRLAAYLYSGDEQIVSGHTGLVAGTEGESLLDDTRRVQIAIPTNGETIDGDIELRLSLRGTGTDAAEPADIYALYGSTAHPSHLSAGVTAESLEALDGPSGFARTYYFDDESFTMEPPTSEESKTRSHDVLGVENIATSAGMVWGSTIVEEDMEFIGDATLTFWLTHSGDPAIMRTVRPEIHIGGETVTQTGGIDAWPFADGETYGFEIGFPTAGMEVAAGTEIQVDIILWSTNSDEVGTIDYLYGSTVHPAGLTLRVAGDAPGAEPGLPELNMTSERTEANVAPGGSTNFTVQIENLGETNATVDFNATTDDALTVSYPEATNLTINGNATEQAGFNVAVSPDALINTTHTVNFTAEVDGVPVGNLTFTIQVVRAEEADEEQDLGDSSNGNETDGSGDGLEEETGFLPAPGVVPILLLGFVALKILRRRRSSG